MIRSYLLRMVVLGAVLGLTACVPNLATSPLATPVSPLPTFTPLPSPTWTPTAKPSPTLTETVWLTPTETPAPTPAPEYTGGAWECWDRGQSVPCPYDASLSLKQITFVSDTEAWAVGADGYIARWDGYTWRRVESPTDKDLNDVVFLSPDNGWAVGEGGVILHWDGRAWSVAREPQPSPPPGGYSLIWNAIGFSSPTDGWVVGTEYSEGGGSGYTMHWNGTAWEEPPQIPQPYDIYSSPLFLLDVIAFSPHDAWVVGENHRGGLTLRWDGYLWIVVPNPFASLKFGRCWLYSISAISPDSIWVAGIFLGGAGISNQGIVIHWNSARWIDMQLPETGWVTAVLASSEDNVWIGGDELFHWNGQGWEKAVKPTSDRVMDIKSSPNGEIWALTQHGAFLHLVAQGDAR